MNGLKILNLTQHEPTPKQIEEGVFDEKGDVRKMIITLLNFKELPLPNEIMLRALMLAKIAYDSKVKYVLIGGAPYLMPSLVEQLKGFGITPLFSFSERKSIEKVEDGKVIKSSVFEHVGFVRIPEVNTNPFFLQKEEEEKEEKKKEVSV